MSLKNFEILSRLGTGSYSTVYKVRRKADGQVYALKQVPMQNLRDKEKANAVNEVRILASVSHPNVVAYYEAFMDLPSSSLCIVMEFADSGDLLEKIRMHKRLDVHIPEAEIWKVFADVVQGLNALHELHILHRDIKSANVFLSSTCAKLGDLNVAKVAQQGLLNTQTGTPYYASPEVWKDQPYDFKCDVWSLGCVLYEMAALNPPFTGKDMDALYKKVVRGMYQPIPDFYSPDLSIMIRNLLQVSPLSRPSSKRLLQLLTRSGRIEQQQVPTTPKFLLNTIHFPKKLDDLSELFPTPKYKQRKENSRLHNLSFDREASRVHSSVTTRSSSTRPRDRLIDLSHMREHVISSRLPPEFHLPLLKRPS